MLLFSPIRQDLYSPSFRYEDANGDKLLEDSEKLVRDLERQISQLDNEISDLQQEIAALRDDLSNSDQRAQNIDNNISYREAEQQIEQLKEEIDQIDLEEAARAKQQFDTKYQRAERERTETYAKVCIGTMIPLHRAYQQSLSLSPSLFSSNKQSVRSRR